MTRPLAFVAIALAAAILVGTVFLLTRASGPAGSGPEVDPGAAAVDPRNMPPPQSLAPRAIRRTVRLGGRLLIRAEASGQRIGRVRIARAEAPEKDLRPEAVRFDQITGIIDYPAFEPGAYLLHFLASEPSVVLPVTIVAGRVATVVAPP